MAGHTGLSWCTLIEQIIDSRYFFFLGVFHSKQSDQRHSLLRQTMICRISYLSILFTLFVGNLAQRLFSFKLQNEKHYVFFSFLVWCSEAGKCWQQGDFTRLVSPSLLELLPVLSCCCMLHCFLRVVVVFLVSGARLVVLIIYIYIYIYTVLWPYGQW